VKSLKSVFGATILMMGLFLSSQVFAHGPGLCDGLTWDDFQVVRARKDGNKILAFLDVNQANLIFQNGRLSLKWDQAQAIPGSERFDRLWLDQNVPNQPELYIRMINAKRTYQTYSILIVEEGFSRVAGDSGCYRFIRPARLEM